MIKSFLLTFFPFPNTFQVLDRTVELYLKEHSFYKSRVLYGNENYRVRFDENVSLCSVYR